MRKIKLWIKRLVCLHNYDQIEVSFISREKALQYGAKHLIGAEHVWGKCKKCGYEWSGFTGRYKNG